MLHDLLELSPSPIISVEYEHRRYFYWFVVCGTFLKMEGDANFFPDGWLSDADDPSPAPPDADDPSPAPPDADDPSSAPPAKKKKLSLSLKKKARTFRSSATRFATPVSEVHFVEAAKGVVPMNTKRNNAWGERAFRAWVEERNKTMPSDPVPDDLLACHDPTIVSKYMRYFVLEARAKDGKKYPPATIRCILSALSRIYKESKAPFFILDKANPAFQELHLTLDRVTSDLYREGIGVSKKSAIVIPFEHENLFWEKQLLGYSTPKALQRAVFFSVGLNFVLRGVQEHHDLQLQQLSRHPPDTSVYSEAVYYQYTEFISKNNQHRFKDVNASNKSCRVYAQPGSERCVVRLIDLYIAKLPENPPAFYLRPLDKVPSSDDKPWYCKSRVGVNKLKTIITEISVEAGLQVHYTNHSLRATAVTRMYNTGVPENLIAEKSGHRSLKALRAYKRTSEDQEKLAGQSIQVGKEFRAVVVDKENCAPECVHDGFDTGKTAPPNGSGPGKSGVGPLQQFSGLSHCTFNFYQS